MIIHWGVYFLQCGVYRCFRVGGFLCVWWNYMELLAAVLCLKHLALTVVLHKQASRYSAVRVSPSGNDLPVLARVCLSLVTPCWPCWHLPLCRNLLSQAGGRCFIQDQNWSSCMPTWWKVQFISYRFAPKCGGDNWECKCIISKKPLCIPMPAATSVFLWPTVWGCIHPKAWWPLIGFV